jgi:hypothetical protein
VFRKVISFSYFIELLVGVVLVASPMTAIAQRHGGGGHGGAGSLSGGSGRPSGVDEKDSLKDFHHALAVQATGQQMNEFQAVIKSTETAKAELQALLAGGSKKEESASPNVRLDQSLESARAENKKFVEGFSTAQKSGLKDITKRLEKTDSDLEQEEKKLDQSLLAAGGVAIGSRADALGKALEDFSNQQLALGREMGITLATGQDLSFTLPPVKSPVSMGNQSVAVTVSGELTQVSAQAGRRIYTLELLADLPEVQENITAIMRAQLDTSGRCGERVAVRQAILSPSSPASLLVLQLHYERWTCPGGAGQSISTELAESDGRVEIKLTPALEKSGELKLAAAFQRIDASGMMGDSLRSGMLGDDLRERVSDALLSALRAGADLKTALPPAVRNSATLQSVRFQDSGAGRLSAALEGQIQISDEQANSLASQLNQALSAQQTPTQ